MIRKYCIILWCSVILCYAMPLTLSLSANPSRLNPLLATDSASSEVANWLFNGLVKYSPEGKIIPDLCEKWEFISPTQLEFTLRKNLVWSDGTPLTTKDVVFTYKLTKRDDIFSPYTDEFRFVKDVVALSQTRLRVTYSQPYFKALDIWMSAILPAHILDKEKDIMTSVFNTHPLGQGAYTLKTFEIGKEIELQANKHYFLHPPYISTIRYRFLPDANAAFMALKAGKVDIGEISALQYKRQWDSALQKQFHVIEQEGRNYTYLGFNLKNAKFKDKRIRQAISLAINRQEIVDLLFFGHAKVCTGPFLPKTYAYNPSILSPQPNYSLAKKLLAEVGYTPSHPLQFELTTAISNPTRLYAAQIIQKQLAKVGIIVSIRVLEWQAFLKTVVTPRRFESILLGWSMGLTPDAYSIWHSQSQRKGGFNFIGYENPHVDKLIDESEREIDRQKLGAMYQKIFALITEDIPYVFLYIPSSLTAVKKTISPIQPSLIGIMHNQIEWKIEP